MGNNQATGAVNNTQQVRRYPANYFMDAYQANAMIMGDDSIFGTAPIAGGLTYTGDLMSSPFSGYNYSGGGYGGYGGYNSGYYGRGPGSETMNMTQEEYLKYQYQLQTVKMQEDAKLKQAAGRERFNANAGERSLNRRLDALHRSVRSNQDHVLDEYNKSKETLKATLAKNKMLDTSLSDEQIDEQLKGTLDAMYEEKFGKGIVDDLEANGHSSFVQGLIEGAGFGLGGALTSSRSVGQNREAITGEAESRTEVNVRRLGRFTAGAATGGAAFGLGALALKNIKNVKAKGWLGAAFVIGGGLAALAFGGSKSAESAS